MTLTTPETLCWPLGGALVTAVQEGTETAITLTVTTPGSVTDPRAALATLATALQAAARERRNLTQNPRSGIVDNKAVSCE